MPLPRFRLRTVMIAVAIVALAIVFASPLWRPAPGIDTFDANEMLDEVPRDGQLSPIGPAPESPE